VQPGRTLKKSFQLLAVVTAMQLLSGCYIFNFFNKKSSSGGGGAADVYTGTVIGQTLGSKAGGPDEAALASIRAVPTTHAPAALRPDPDLFVRRLLLQYRDEGATVARQIGTVEQYRLLLGGASEDFSKMPQDSYDATSLLAVFKVAEEVCRGLVAPNQWEHEGWSTILPYSADKESENIAWLAQRIIGVPSSELSPTALSELQTIMDNEEAYITENWWADGNAFAKYIPVCATLALDAEAMYF
jgi:hypothetical protein